MTLKNLKTLPIRVVSAYSAYRHHRAITSDVTDLDRTLSLGPSCSEIPGIFPPFPCCHTILRAYQQGQKNVQLGATREEKDRKGRGRKGKKRRGKGRKGRDKKRKEWTGRERKGQERKKKGKIRKAENE